MTAPEKNNHLGAYHDWEKFISPKSDTQLYPVWIKPRKGKEASSAEVEDALRNLHKPPLILVDVIEAEILGILVKQKTDLDNYRLLVYVQLNNTDQLPELIKQYFEVIYVGPGVETKPIFNLPLAFGVGRADFSNPIGAIVDDGIAYHNRKFFNNVTNTSRFKAVWIQATPSEENDNNGNHVSVGQIVSPNCSDCKHAYNDEAHQYRCDHQLVSGENMDYSTKRAISHGTHVADIAFGSDSDNDEDNWMRGVDLLGVELPRPSILASHGKYLDTNILQGVRWLIAKAIEYSIEHGLWRPLIINLSLGSHAGAKDGSDFLAKQIAYYMELYAVIAGVDPEDKARFSRAVLSYGNHGSDTLTALISVNKKNNGEKVVWRVQPDDYTSSYLEIQGTGTSIPGFSLVAPDDTTHEVLRPLDQGKYQEVKNESGRIIGRIYSEHINADSKATNRIVIALAPTSTHYLNHIRSIAGAWTLEFPYTDGEYKVGLQVSRDDTPSDFLPSGRQSYLEHETTDRHPDENHRTSSDSPPLGYGGNHSSWVNHQQTHVLSVGASVADRHAQIKAWENTSSGSEHDELGNHRGPTHSALGSETPAYQGRLASGTFSGSSARMAGTSVAAPN